MQHTVLLLLLAYAATESVPTQQQTPLLASASACSTALASACPQTMKGSKGVLQCDMCAGQHQHELLNASCTAAEVQSWCAFHEAGPKTAFRLPPRFSASVSATTGAINVAPIGGGDLLTVESSFSISPQTGGDQANSCAQYQPPGFSCVVTKAGISRGRSR